MNHEQATEAADGIAKAIDYNETLTSSQVKRCIHACTMYVADRVKRITKTGWSGVREAFQKHPRELKQTYYEHFKETAKHAGRKLKEACSLITHAVLPFMGTHVTYAAYTPKPKVSAPLHVSDRALDALELAALDIAADTKRIHDELVSHQEIKQALHEALLEAALTGSSTPRVLQNVEKWE